MKKKILCLLLCAVLVVAAVAALVACGPKNDEHVLNVICLNKGYGKEWIEAIVTEFEAQHPGYSVNLEASGDAKSLINNHIHSRKNIDDLYICVGADWMAYAAEGLFAELDDLIEEEVDGVKIKDKVATEYKNSIYYPDVRTGQLHTYRLPWISATGGIYYNKKMFEDNGWTVPQTYEQLVALCAQIVEDNVHVSGSGFSQEIVKPFVYTGTNTDYFDYAVYTWWAQLAGEDAIKDFTKYDDKTNFDASVTDSTYSYLKQAVGLWQGLVCNSANVVADCSGKSNYDAQNDFVQGKAAMMFNGDWMYNEILKYGTIDEDKFQLAFMPTPTAPGCDAENTDMLYTIGEDQYFAIPKSSIKKDLAKDFIKLIVSDFGCKTFLTKANGLLAYSCDYSDVIGQTNAFIQGLVSTRSSYAKPFTEFPADMSGDVLHSNKMLYLSHTINVWGTSALRPYVNMLNGKSLTDAFNDIKSGVNRDWESWLKNNGLK